MPDQRASHAPLIGVWAIQFLADCADGGGGQGWCRGL